MLELNKIYNMDCLEGMKMLDDCCIDLTVTSPPYDNLRDYNGFSFDFEGIAKELFRITKDGGVVVWIVADATINGSETGTSFKQALYFMECGFKLHDTMIWKKPNAMPNICKTRYTPSFEYMFVFSKGKPKTANMLRIKTKFGGEKHSVKTYNSQSMMKDRKNEIVKNDRIAFNIWECCLGGRSYGHPAVFPEKIAKDHILSWSNPNDVVLDTFMGSGTTAKMAIETSRQYIGFEISKEYCEIIAERLSGVQLGIQF